MQKKEEEKVYRQKSTLLLKKLINMYMVLPTYLSLVIDQMCLLYQQLKQYQQSKA